MSGLAQSSIFTVLRSALSSPSENGRPVTIRNRGEAIVAFCHAMMVAVGFRLVGLGDEGQIATTAPQRPMRPLPQTWNQTTGMYAFRYKHEQSSLTFLLKMVTMTNKIQVHGMGVEDGKTFHSEINIPDYIAPTTSFPFTLTDSVTVDSMFQNAKLDGLIADFKVNIIQKLIPGLGKEGYEETRTQTDSQTQTQRRPYQRQEPPMMPLHDPYYARPYLGGSQPTVSPFSIGRSDLDPLGGIPMGGPTPFGGPPSNWRGLGPEGPQFGNIGGGMGGGSGMFVDPHHPMFGSIRGPGRGDMPANPGVLPRGAVPPGARFDPITPLGPQPLPRPGPLGGPAGLRSGEPDNDELPPPGYNDIFM